jgi:hypothetical protein
LASPQKAISFAYQNSGALQVLRYNGPLAGTDPFGRDFKTGKPLPPAERRPTELDTSLIKPGDVCLVREDGNVKPANPDGWKHVCLVHSILGDDFQTLDGNQGSPAIKLTDTKSFSSTISNGSYKFVFVHVR